MLFAYDGTGLGHLMRLVKIAWGLSRECRVLVVSGHKAMPEIVPSGVQYRILPNFLELREERGYTDMQTNKVRIEALEKLLKDFAPNAFVTDYLPLGKRSELAHIIAHYDCLKYFVLRSKIGGKKLTYEEVFSPRNIEVFRAYYDRILLASDPLITPPSMYSWLPKDIKEMITYTGCVTYPVTHAQVERTRAAFLGGEGLKWMVCSAGGGRTSKEFSTKCIEMSMDERLADWKIDIILGNYSTIQWPYGRPEIVVKENVTVYRSMSDMYLLHASADCVVCAGGYNSLLEAMQGKTKHVFSYSVMDIDTEDEQACNIRDFGKHYSITAIRSLNSLTEEVLNGLHTTLVNEERVPNANGIDNIATLILSDINNKDQVETAKRT